LSGVHAIDQDVALLGFVEAQQQSPNGRSPESDPSDDANLFTAASILNETFSCVAGGLDRQS
jgi:hypothetical protein